MSVNLLSEGKSGLKHLLLFELKAFAPLLIELDLLHLLLTSVNFSSRLSGNHIELFFSLHDVELFLDVLVPLPLVESFTELSVLLLNLILEVFGSVLEVFEHLIADLNLVLGTARAILTFDHVLSLFLLRKKLLSLVSHCHLSQVLIFSSLFDGP